MTRVAVLGSAGMLGSMLSAVLAETPKTSVIEVARGLDGRSFDAATDDPARLLDELGCDWALNAIAILRSKIEETDPGSVAAARAVNGDFPHRLAAAALATGTRLIHFSTDAVFGPGGPHAEAAAHLGRGVYARSKSEGEPDPASTLVLRCSILGRDAGAPHSLLGWALSRPTGATINGYTDSFWNGVTTWHLAKLCSAIITEGDPIPSPLHIVPADVVSKAMLLELALATFGRHDVHVNPVAAGATGTTLATSHPHAHRRLWSAGGWPRPPTVASMLTELAGVQLSGGRLTRRP